jgi:transcriptional/translational regulatory protein YebC/TACO1
VSELRHILAKHGGNLGEAGCVNWIFHKKGIIIVKDPNTTEDALMELVLEYGAEDITSEEKNSFEIITEPSGLEQIKNILLQAGICIETAEVTSLPQSTVQLDGKTAAAALKLVERLEEHEDVQNVHANFDIPIEIMEEIASVV